MNVFESHRRTPEIVTSQRCLGPYVTTNSETIVVFSAPISENRTYYSHLVIMGRSADATAALMFIGDYVTRRPVSGTVTLACARAQTDEDFPNPSPSVSVAVNVATQSVELKVTGRPATTITWLGMVDSFRNVT